MSSDSQCWRVPAHAGLMWRCWDGEYVFHHLLSNDTHRLAEIPGQLLAHIATAGEQTTAQLAQHFLIDETDIEYVLEELVRLDFVTCSL